MSAPGTRPEPGERWRCKYPAPEASWQAYDVKGVDETHAHMINGSSFPLSEWDNPPDAYDKPRWTRLESAP